METATQTTKGLTTPQSTTPATTNGVSTPKPSELGTKSPTDSSEDKREDMEATKKQVNHITTKM